MITDKNRLKSFFLSASATVLAVIAFSSAFVMAEGWDYDDHHLGLTGVSGNYSTSPDPESVTSVTDWDYHDHYLVHPRVCDMIDHASEGGPQVDEWDYDLYHNRTGSHEHDHMAMQHKRPGSM